MSKVFVILTAVWCEPPPASHQQFGTTPHAPRNQRTHPERTNLIWSPRSCSAVSLVTGRHPHLLRRPPHQRGTLAVAAVGGVAALLGAVSCYRGVGFGRMVGWLACMLAAGSFAARTQGHTASLLVLTAAAAEKGLLPLILIKGNWRVADRALNHRLPNGPARWPAHAQGGRHFGR